MIGVFETRHLCLRILIAHADSGTRGPGANDNASGLGVLAALAPRLRSLDAGDEPCRELACDRPGRLRRSSLAAAQRIVERALRRP